jgi:predicted nucleic acid-binding Zn ribbon protein
VFDESIPMHKYAEIDRNHKMKFKCPKCEQLMNPARVLSTVPIVFKGKGFYSTDNRKKEDVDVG